MDDILAIYMSACAQVCFSVQRTDTGTRLKAPFFLFHPVLGGGDGRAERKKKKMTTILLVSYFCYKKQKCL